jgi:hypothetical protein
MARLVEVRARNRAIGKQARPELCSPPGTGKSPRHKPNLAKFIRQGKCFSREPRRSGAVPPGIDGRRRAAFKGCSSPSGRPKEKSGWTSRERSRGRQHSAIIGLTAASPHSTRLSRETTVRCLTAPPRSGSATLDRRRDGAVEHGPQPEPSPENAAPATDPVRTARPEVQNDRADAQPDPGPGARTGRHGGNIREALRNLYLLNAGIDPMVI